MMPETGVSQGLCICTNTKVTRRAEFNRTCCSVSSAGEGVGCSIVNTFCIYIIAPEARFCSTANSWHWGFSMFHTSAVLIRWLSEDDWKEVKQVEDGPFLSILEVYGHRVGSTWDLGSLHTVYHAILKCYSMIHETNTRKTCLGLRARTKHQIRQSSRLYFAQMVKRLITKAQWSIEWVHYLIMHWHSGQRAGS